MIAPKKATLHDAIFAHWVPRQARDVLQFAEEEIILPTGPHAGLPFSTDTMPWTRYPLEEFSAGRFRRFMASGPVQSGKTLIFFAIPILYHLFEIGEDVIVGVPSIELAQGIYNEKILPVIKSSKYRDQLPQKGAGSRGGKFISVQFRNGSFLRFLGAGGDDAQRASHTARVIVMTELDKMDQPGEMSRESDPVTQIESRADAFSDHALIYGECTMTSKDGRIWQEIYKVGSGSEIHIRCPHCNAWQFPKRENLQRWQEAESEGEARARTAYCCPHCEVYWSEKDREKALSHDNVRMVHRWQTLTKTGRVRKKAKEAGRQSTDTFGIHWNGFHNSLRTQANIGVEEWKARDAEDIPRELKEKRLCQFVWSIPYHEGDTEDPQLDEEFLIQHIGKHEMWTIPKGENAQDTRFVTAAIDVQKKVVYFLVESWDLDLTCWTVGWDFRQIIPFERTIDPTPGEVLAALNSALEEIKKYNPHSVWVDSGYKHHESRRSLIREWCRSKPGRVYSLVGRSHGQMEKMVGKELVGLPQSISEMMQERRQKDGTRLWFLDVDRLKDLVYFSFFRERNGPGYHYLPVELHGDTWYIKHMTGETREMKWTPGKGDVRTWIQKRKRHDLLDCSAYAYAGALLARSQIKRPSSPSSPASDGKKTTKQRPIRREYG